MSDETETTVETVKPSTIWFAACLAAEAKLPAASRTLIQRRDELERAWAKSGYKGRVPLELAEAMQAVQADELAKVAMDCRVLGNDAWRKELQR